MCAGPGCLRNRSLILGRPIPGGVVTLKIKTLGANVTVWANDGVILSFVDLDPAAGTFGLGSVGSMKFRNVNQ